MPGQTTVAVLLRLLLSVLIITNSFVVLVATQNIDTEKPILREVNGLANGSLFGYSLVLHQTLSNPFNMTEAISGARIVVSAPKGTAPGGSVPNTGLVYSCPVNPGTCSPLPGKLFDTTANNIDENKTDQFLGGSMASIGDRFMVCAHRYTYISQSFGVKFPYPFGKCFFTTGRTLDNFQEYQPCFTTSSLLKCQAGTSATIVPDGDSYAFGVGAPGVGSWQGSIIRRNGAGVISFQDERSSSSRYAYQGYTITSGRFLTTNRQDFMVSLPRRNFYFGSVNLVMNDNSLQFISQPLTGMQMGEYYGFSLLAVDLNGDNFDEVLVGAPLYTANLTEPETGRVFLYRNNGGSLQFLRVIVGKIRYSRFGYAMANLGDINGDGFDDVAISAPFTETGSNDPGTVFIYHSTPILLLSNEPQQIIRGTDLGLDLSGLRGFGTSLASGVDVDANSYKDLLVGSFLSQQAFLLRTRPIAHTQITISANPLIIDVLDRTRPECVINSTQFACFDLTTCAAYSGRGLTPTLNLRITVSGDVENVEQRIIFENGNTKFTREVTANINMQRCETFKAYIRNSILADIFNPFIMDTSVNIPPRHIIPGNGNETLEDLSGFPVVTVTGMSQVQVETLKQCEGGECIPDLRISVTGTQTNPREYGSSAITAGLKTSVDIFMNIENAAEDAFQASLSFFLPTNLLELVNIFNQTRNGEVTLRCLSEPFVELMDQTHHSCSIGNPFLGPGSLQLRVQLLPSNDIIGNENDIIINFTVSSINPENGSTILDDSNSDSVQLSFEARANITIDNGVVMPERISYSDNSAISEGVALTNVSQLGPPVDVSFLIRNSGPSRVSNIQLDISWPLNSSMVGENYYLYITSIQSSGAAAVTCSKQYINPLNLEGDFSDQGDEEGGDPTIGMGTGRRKKRSTVKRTLRNKRQEEASTEQGLSENITLSCMSSELDTMINCVNIRCNLHGLPGSSSVQVDVNARLDERFFSINNDHYTITSVASISIVDGDFIQSNDDSSQRRAKAEIFVIPAARVVRVNPEGASSVEWWVIVVPIIAAMIVITVVGVLLWVFGFFNRQKHEEIKQKREEIQNLDEHGVTPMGAGVYGMGMSQNSSKWDGTDL